MPMYVIRISSVVASEENMCLSLPRHNIEIPMHTLQYSEGVTSTIFKIEIGAVDRGADVGFLSQYPKEDEVLFPPFSYLEVLGHVR